MANKIQLRRGTKAQLTSLGPLAVGEPGFTTDTRELFVGSSSGNVQIATSDEVSVRAQKGTMAADRFRRAARDITKEQAFYVIGDSIAVGATATDYQNDAFVGIVRKALNIDYANKNFGFESIGITTGKNHYHVLGTFNFNLEMNAAYYGGQVARSTASGGYITVDYVGKDCKLVYGGRADGGKLNVSVDGAAWGTIDTSVIGAYTNGSISLPIITSGWGAHQIIFQKVDTKNTDICGLMYADYSAGTPQPILHNASRSGIYLTQIPDTVLDQYTDSGMVILAMGVNDNLQSTPIATFKSKVEYIASRVDSRGGSMLILDFMYNTLSNTYKTVLKDVAIKYPQFGYADFGAIWFGDSTKNIAAGLLNSDGLHPTDYGHEQIAQVILRHLNLPYSKQTVNFVPDSAWMPLEFANGWSAFGVAGDIPSYKLYHNGTVRLRGILKGGTISVGVVMAKLPVGRRPKMLKVMSTTANGLPTEIKINPDGTIVLSGSNGAGFVTLDNISFELD
ncbi:MULTISPECIES: SGNH/GDSL hydrolase family protein [Paenibacillus]|uniref:hyaluronate lyase N-terminal domain-containing protein n=1 Tax=Paenibacillus TaxID=44249 RepID=UPI00097000A8|nr:SGNH/GDSL hydrolase family protein [Paenibacillus odorifer]OME21595.1 hypothetical protein BSK57_19815 [Paenibacillus odorifer]